MNVFKALCTSLGHMLRLTHCYNWLCQFSHKHAILQTQMHHSADKITIFMRYVHKGVQIYVDASSFMLKHFLHHILDGFQYPKPLISAFVLIGKDQR